MTATTSGEIEIQAFYSGDGNNTANSGTTALTIDQLATTLSLSCKSTSLNVWTCTATLKGYYGSVAGEALTWKQTAGPDVFFQSTACILSLSGACSITVSGQSPGKATIEAIYPGDANSISSHKTKTLIVRA
jgi:hypothetical protein